MRLLGGEVSVLRIGLVTKEVNKLLAAAFCVEIIEVWGELRCWGGEVRSNV